MNPSQELQRVGNSAVSQFGDLVDEVSVNASPAIVTAAVTAKALVAARIEAAHKWPRNVDQFRIDILKDCSRPGFAEAALFHKPVGKKKTETGQWVENFAIDFSIRFVEAALAHFCNVHTIADVVHEDQASITISVAVLDTQRNTGFHLMERVEKLVEKREKRGGRTVIGERENTYGDTVYLYRATPDEVRNLVGAARSKLIRDNGKRLIPADILAECREVIDRVVKDEHARDPDAAKKKIIDRFASLGVSPTMLVEYLGRPVETLRQADIEELGAVFNALRDSETSWPELMAMRERPAEGEPLPAGATASARAKQRVADKAGEPKA